MTKTRVAKWPYKLTWLYQSPFWKIIVSPSLFVQQGLNMSQVGEESKATDKGSSVLEYESCFFLGGVIKMRNITRMPKCEQAIQ